MDEIFAAADDAVTDTAWRSRAHFEDLLCKLFDDAGFRQWVKLGPQGDLVAGLIPGPPISLQSLIHASVDVLLRHGLVDGAMFEALLTRFPRRSADIRSAMSSWVRERPGGIACPAPETESLATRSLSDALAGAYAARENLVVAGDSTSAIDLKILGLRRRLRSGPQFQPGESLNQGRYRLISLLGQGGYASVWKAYDREAGELVAIKVMHGQWSADRSVRERFARGARSMAKLAHPAITRVRRGMSEDDGFFYYVMDLATGDLRAAILAGAIDAVASIAIVQTICAALQQAHQSGVVHRDVKPANILLDAAGRPSLTDFDLVKVAHSTGGTRTGAMGTFFYTAPEMMHSAAEADPRADIFGLGMTLLFCLRRQEIDFAAFRNPRKAIEELPVSAALKEVVARSTEDDVDARFPDCAALAAALAAASQLDTDPSGTMSSFMSRRGQDALTFEDRLVLARFEDNIHDHLHRDRDATYPLSNGFFLRILHAELPRVGGVDVIFFTVDSDGKPDAYGRELIEYGGLPILDGLVPLSSCSPGKVVQLPAERLRVGMVMAVARFPGLVGGLAAVVSTCLNAAASFRSVAFPLLGADGLDETFESSLRAIVAGCVKASGPHRAPASNLTEICIILSTSIDTRRPVIYVDLSPWTETDVPPQTFYIEDFTDTQELCNALWRAFPAERQPPPFSIGTAWYLYDLDSGRSLGLGDAPIGGGRDYRRVLDAGFRAGMRLEVRRP